MSFKNVFVFIRLVQFKYYSCQSVIFVFNIIRVKVSFSCLILSMIKCQFVSNVIHVNCRFFFLKKISFCVKLFFVIVIVPCRVVFMFIFHLFILFLVFSF